MTDGKCVSASGNNLLNIRTCSTFTVPLILKRPDQTKVNRPAETLNVYQESPVSSCVVDHPSKMWNTLQHNYFSSPPPPYYHHTKPFLPSPQTSFYSRAPCDLQPSFRDISLSIPIRRTFPCVAPIPHVKTPAPTIPSYLAPTIPSYLAPAPTYCLPTLPITNLFNPAAAAVAAVPVSAAKSEDSRKPSAKPKVSRKRPAASQSCAAQHPPVIRKKGSPSSAKSSSSSSKRKQPSKTSSAGPVRTKTSNNSSESDTKKPTIAGRTARNAGATNSKRRANPNCTMQTNPSRKRPAPRTRYYRDMEYAREYKNEEELRSKFKGIDYYLFDERDVISAMADAIAEARNNVTKIQ